MNTHNAAIALLSENLLSVHVRFKVGNGNLSDKTYTYQSTIAVKAGDEVVVNSPYDGYKVAVVDSVDNSMIDINSNYTYKFIVQRVDVEADLARDEVVEEIKFHINEKQRQSALKEFRKALGLTKGDKLSKLVKKINESFGK